MSAFEMKFLSSYVVHFWEEDDQDYDYGDEDPFDDRDWGNEDEELS